MIEYSKLSDALDALESRRHLRPKIEEYLREHGVGLPWEEALGSGKPLAVLFRQVATPNYEIIRFLSIASGFGMQPVILEYLDDKLSMENEYKKALVCAPIVKRISSKGHVQFEKKWLCEPNAAKPMTALKDLVSSTGNSIVETHHELLKKTHLSEGCKIIDGSPWFGLSGKSARDYYQNFFSLFVSHAILFENFMTEGYEGGFTRDIALPSFEGIRSAIGEKPLVVPINPTETEDASFWVCYPKEVFE